MLARMLAIFYSIMHERPSSSAAIFTQVSSLLTLGLLCPVSAPGTLDDPKYRCNVSRETVQALARNVGFELHRFLAE